jgi:hypothetical protein
MRAAEPALPASAAEPTPSAPQAPGRVEAEALPAVRALRFEPAPDLPPAGAEAHVEILFPFAEQRIRPDRANEFVVRMSVSHWRSELVDVSLDDFLPRRRDTLPTALRLRDLVPDDRELEPGEHLLVATAVHEDGRLVRAREPRSRGPFAAVRFWVGESRAARHDLGQRQILYRQPRGTYNGPDAADNVLVDFLVLGGESADSLHARVGVRGSGVAGSTLLERMGAVYVRDLPSGDFDVVIELLDGEHRSVKWPGGRASRTITVNRDAPAPGKRP